MPKLCDIVKPGVPCKVKRPSGSEWHWNGYTIALSVGSPYYPYHSEIIFGDDWQLDEPTVESVLRERGYEVRDGSRTDYKIESLTNQRHCFMCRYENRPTTAAQITAICDLLDQYR